MLEEFYKLNKKP